MAKFKEGDVVIKLQSDCYPAVMGKRYTLVKDDDGLVCIKTQNSSGVRCLCHETWELVEYNNSNNKNMGIIEKFTGMFLSEPEKTFRKAGITNNEGMLTEEGRVIFSGFLLKKYGDDFKKEVVDELLKDEDK